MVLDLQDVPACWQVLCNYDPRRLGHDRVGWALSMQDQVCPTIYVAYLSGACGIDVYSQQMVVGGFLASLEQTFVEDDLVISLDSHLDWEGQSF